MDDGRRPRLVHETQCNRWSNALTPEYSPQMNRLAGEWVCCHRITPAMEATWAGLSYNITRWFSIRRKLSTAALA
jgi:hypothetical protein